MKITALQTIKAGGEYRAPGTVIDLGDDIAKTLIEAGAAERADGAGVEAVEHKSAIEVLALASTPGVHFKTFEAEAKKLLRTKLADGSKKPEIIATLVGEMDDADLKAFLAGKGVTITDETREQLAELAKSA